MKRFRLDTDAQADLLSIHAYIAKDNPPAADRLLQRIKERFRLLAVQPTLGERRPELAVDLRAFCVGSYVILYRPAKSGIEIARVLHAARDIDALF